MKGYLDTTQLASRYGVSTDLVRQWKRYEGFPRHTCKKKGCTIMWSVKAVDAWLKARPILKTGRPPISKWLEVVGHPSLSEG